MAPAPFASLLQLLGAGAGRGGTNPAAAGGRTDEEKASSSSTITSSSSSSTSGCPFGFGGGGGAEAEAPAPGVQEDEGPAPLFGRRKVVVLYEQYIHLPPLRDVWEHPVTEKPELEPCFAAACHAMEICFLLLAAFVQDSRAYVVKRPRVELVAEDLARQCALLAEIVDGELEEGPPTSPIPTSSAATTAQEAFSKLVGGAGPDSPVLALDDGSSGSSSGGLVSPLSTDSLASLTTTVATGPSSSSSGMPGTPLALGGWSRSSLTQHFPFPGCPPTTCEAARSPALELLREAVSQSLPTLSPSERVSLVKVIRNVTNAVEALVAGWTVGLGLEAQLNALRESVGLPRLPALDAFSAFLDYRRLVRPEVVAATYEDEAYAHSEDFFFRSVHLGTDCWAFVVHNRLEGARELAERGEWHNAAARARQAAHILTYLGRHVLMLTSMVLRDYLELKVEIEGTSGEGSKLVKAFRPAGKRLLAPLAAALLALPPPPADDDIDDNDEAAAAQLQEREGEGEGDEEGERGDEQARVRAALLRVYAAPELHPQLYTYAKALELLETGLVSGFYYAHFCLATNVIGLEARGTMNRAVKALKATYETPLFPVLDQTRSTLGARMDARLRHLKGKLLRNIEEALAAGKTPASSVVA